MVKQLHWCDKLRTHTYYSFSLPSSIQQWVGFFLPPCCPADWLRYVIEVILLICNLHPVKFCFGHFRHRWRTSSVKKKKKILDSFCRFISHFYPTLNCLFFLIKMWKLIFWILFQLFRFSVLSSRAVLALCVVSLGLYVLECVCDCKKGWFVLYRWDDMVNNPYLSVCLFSCNDSESLTRLYAISQPASQWIIHSY